MRCWSPTPSWPGLLIRQFTRCKVIGRLGLDAANIDLPTALAMSITVTAVPDYCVREVSDHTMALLLALVRKIPLSNGFAQSGRWDAAALAPIPRLAGRVLGPRRLRRDCAAGRAEGEIIRVTRCRV